MNTIQDKLEIVFNTFGHRIAIDNGKLKLTYRELNQASEHVKNILEQCGAKKGSHVGIFIEDKTQLTIAIIGILKANCVFIPLDTRYPELRLKRMIEYSDSDFVLTDGNSFKSASSIFQQQVRILNIDRADIDKEDTKNVSITKFSPKDPLYIYFTSGSSGQPKAILGKNESLLHFINWEIELLSLNETARVSYLTSPSFDASLRDIFVPLCTGGTLCIPENQEMILDKTRFNNWVEDSKVQVVHCTPSIFQLLISHKLESSSFPYLKYVFLSGEKIIPTSLEKWYNTIGERIQLINLYGPTETTMVKMYYFIQRNDTSKSNIPIGRAISETSCYILDENLNRCANGDVGEIYIETPYMTLGYYGNQKLNDERFIKHPDATYKGYLYKTGDLGRVLSNGNMEFLGRIDSQIKLRGNRIELGEIENECLSFPGVSQCVVDFKDCNELKKTAIVTYCEKCGLPSTYPNTVMDNNICNVCKEYESFKEIANSYFRPLNELKEKFENSRIYSDSKYDCLLLFSGGKDSTYVLYKLIEMGVRVLTFTFDNGFISKTALKNIKRIVNEHKIDHIQGTVDDMNKIFLDGLSEENSVCNGCFKVLSKLSTKIAYKKGIKYIVTGLSRGQIFDLHLYDVLQQGRVQDVEEINKKISEKRHMYHSKNDYVTKYLDPQYKVNKKMLDEVELIDFFRFSDVTKKEIMEFLKLKSSYWNNPADTGFCSSNCLINDVGIHIQRKNKQYDNYTFPNSWEVRIGHISLEDSQMESKSEVDELKVNKILHELGYSENEEGIGKQASYLVAYYVANKPIENIDLRNHLKRSLPDYMIPTFFVPVPNIPLTPNGKIDYSVLPEPQKEIIKRYIAPRDEIEIKLSEIWSDILGIPNISIDDNFLEIGVHSLNIMTLIARVYEEFTVELPLEEVFNNATIEQIANYIKRVDQRNLVVIPQVESRNCYPLSAAQRRVYTDELILEKGKSYNLTTTFRISGKMDLKRLEAAFNQLITRHESLRTSFSIKEGRPVQIVHNKVEFSITHVELQGRDIDEVVNGALQTFDLEKSPLIQGILIRETEEQHILVLNVHHIVADGKSLLILQRDLASLYSGKELPDLKIQYKDYSEWFNNSEERFKTQEQFWLTLFKDFNSRKGLPTDFPRSIERKFKGDFVKWDIDEALCNKLYAVAAEHKTTIFMLLLAGFNILYSKYSANEDITIGTPIEGRRYSELRNIVGMFVNVLAIRSNPSRYKTFRSYLEEIKFLTLKSYENQDYQYDHLLKKLNKNSKLQNPQLFDTVFSMLNYEDYTAKVDNLTFDYIENKATEELYDLRVEIIETPIGFKGIFKYSSELFKRNSIETLVLDYTRLLEILVDNVDIPIKDIELREDVLKKNPNEFAEVVFDF